MKASIRGLPVYHLFWGNDCKKERRAGIKIPNKSKRNVGHICSSGFEWWLWSIYVTPREYWMIYRGPGFAYGRMIWLLPHPLLPSPVSKLSLFFLCVALSDGRGRGGGEGAKSRDGDKAWSSSKTLWCKPTIRQSHRVNYKLNLYSCTGTFMHPQQ